MTTNWWAKEAQDRVRLYTASIWQQRSLQADGQSQTGGDSERATSAQR